MIPRRMVSREHSSGLSGPRRIQSRFSRRLEIRPRCFEAATNSAFNFETFSSHHKTPPQLRALGFPQFLRRCRRAIAAFLPTEKFCYVSRLGVSQSAHDPGKHEKPSSAAAAATASNLFNPAAIPHVSAFFPYRSRISIAALHCSETTVVGTAFLPSARSVVIDCMEP
jgi:hypothetical protein